MLMDLIWQIVSYEILNHLPFIDLIRISEVNKHFYSLCHSQSYLQQRLIYFGLGIKADDKYDNHIDQYVITLISNDQVEADPTCLDYLFQSDKILFPGLERFIGFASLGLRAIKNNDPPIVSYVLKACTRLYERIDVLNALRMRYFESRRMGTEFPFQVGQSIFQSTIRSDYVSRKKFFPVDFKDYDSYCRGQEGEDMPLDEIRNGYLCSYMFGLIEGNHLSLLQRKYSLIGPVVRKHGSQSTFEASIIPYIMVNGSVEMCESFKSKIMKYVKNAKEYEMSMYSDALANQTLDNVKWILGNLKDYMSKLDGFERTIVNRSVLNLLRELNVKVTDHDILIGALQSGNWSLLRSAHIFRIDEKLYKHVFKRSPPYMIEKYFDIVYRKSDSGTKSEVLRYLFNIYLRENDAYRLEAIWRLGFKVSEKDQDEIRKLMRRNPSVLSIENICPLLKKNL